MDPCPFIRLIVESLTLKLPPASPKAQSGAAGSGVHPSSPSNTPYFCSFKLHHQSASLSASSILQQTTTLPVFPGPPAASSPTSSPASSSPVVFHLDPSALHGATKPAALAFTVYSGRSSGSSSTACGLGGGGRRALGRAKVSVDLRGEEVLRNPAVFFNGWVAIGGSSGSKGDAAVPKLHVVVRSEPDPRYVFQFGGEPECSPVVYQLSGGGGGAGRGQPVFSCRFTAERRTSTGSSFLTDDNGPGTPVVSRPPWLRSLSGGGGNAGGGGIGSDNHNHHHHHHHHHSFLLPRRAPQHPRKGWTVTIHDLSGSPVAAASMITPFCPSPSTGSSDRVSRASPGAWLVLQPVASSSFGGVSGNSWKPWGRLEAWRERGGASAAGRGGGDTLGYRFELVGPEPGDPGVRLAEAEIAMRKGGEFRIEIGGVGGVTGPAAVAAAAAGGGFVMSASVEGEGRVSRPRVEVGMQHVRCASDAALFVALAAAVDLSMDACGLFSRKLKKELCYDKQEK